MSKTLVISLIVVSIIWILFILRLIRSRKISIKYSMIWIFSALVLLIVGLFPSFMELVSNLFGFLTISNLVIGILITILFFITLILTMIVTNQKTQINSLIQEVSILKKEK